MPPAAAEAAEAANAAEGSAGPRPDACYTTARVTADGRVLWGDRHVARLVRDAAALGLGRVRADACRRALLRAARARSGGGAGCIVRIEVRRGPGGACHIANTRRELGPDPRTWTAVRSRSLHPGPAPAPGAKRADPPALRAAREQAANRGAEEALLFDAEGFLVEGARSALVVVDAAGRAVTPPLASGAVAGIARGLALERCPELREAPVSPCALAGARELVALNAVRGARAVVRLDGAPVGDGRPGPWARRLARSLAADLEPL